ncbi:MAG: DUF4292 domain-containing protein [Bacteroidia bacterium]|nr:DUF4292 domain-containing protein [Bacteroidia bacterium]
MLSRSNIILSLFLILCIFFTSCKIQKLAKEKKSLIEPTTIIQEYGNKIKTIQARVEYELPGTKPIAVKATMRACIDSALVISIQPFLGIEMGRLHFAKDSIILIDHYHKEYASGSYKDLSSNMLLSYEMIQALLFNRVFDPSNNKYLGFVGSNNNMWQSWTESVDAFDVEFLIDQGKYLRRTVLNSTDKISYLSVEYTDFTNFTDIDYPMTASYMLFSPTYKSMLKLYVDKVIFNTKVDLISSIPQAYTKITISELIKGLIQ